MNMTATQATTDRNICVAALYRFVALTEHVELKEPLLEQMRSLNIRGTLLLASEGINGTIAGDEAAIDTLLAWFARQRKHGPQLTGIEVKKSWTDAMPFSRTKVKLKREIVSMGVDGIDPNESVGTYVEPRNWNKLISDPDVITIDTRNDYEVRIGTFRNAVNPHTKTFRDFPAYARAELDPEKHSKVAMFCTGGIRCEKSTAYLKGLGFDEVYHLQGGVLKYLQDVPKEESLWEGECFVFDKRVAVNHALEPGGYTQCHACRAPLDDSDLQNNLYVPGESCPHCYGQTTEDQRARFRERQNQIALAEERGENHIGDAASAVRDTRLAAKHKYKAEQRKHSS
jgi:UPF0176 protein